jgi:hypothetical protein
MTTETVNLVPVQFYGDTLLAVETPEGYFVSAKPICERLGLDWKTQHRKLTNGERDWGILHMTIPSAGGPQETLCLPVRMLAAWLFAVSPNRVKPENREGLLRYQAEAAQVLDDHFRLKQQQQSEEIARLKRYNRRLRTQVLVARPLWNRIMRLHDAGYHWNSIRIQLGKSMPEWNGLEDALRDCGFFPPLSPPPSQPRAGG